MCVYLMCIGYFGGVRVSFNSGVGWAREGWMYVVAHPHSIVAWILGLVFGFGLDDTRETGEVVSSLRYEG